MPAILRQLFSKAVQARLAVDSAKYEVNAMGTTGIVRYQVAFPVTGPYPKIREFIDATLSAMPAVALNDLAIDRKSITDGSVEAQIRLTVYTFATGTTGAPGSGPPTAVSGLQGPPRAPAPQAPREKLQIDTIVLNVPDRVVEPTHSAALFAQHTWYVIPPAPPPAPPLPPPAPTAPPLPYTFLGSFAPEGQPPVFFLAHGDRVIDAHVGDRLDGVYQFESADAAQLVFVYLPLNVRQTVAAGVPH
jgi:hypothetical protein